MMRVPTDAGNKKISGSETGRRSIAPSRGGVPVLQVLFVLEAFAAETVAFAVAFAVRFGA